MMQIFFRGLESKIDDTIKAKDCLYRVLIEKILNMDEASCNKIMGNFALYLLKGEKEKVDFSNSKLYTGNSIVSVVTANLNFATIEATGVYVKVSAKVNQIERISEVDLFKEFINYLHYYGYTRFSWADYSRMKKMLVGCRKVYPKFKEWDRSDQHKFIKTIATRCGSDHDPHMFANAVAMEMAKRGVDKKLSLKSENIGRRITYELVERYPRFSIYETKHAETEDWQESFSVFQIGDRLLNSL